MPLTAGSGDPGRRHWKAQPLLSLGVRLLVLAIPLAAATLTTVILSRLVAPPVNFFPLVEWWLLILGVSTLTVLVAHRLAQRLVPLAILLDLSLTFPDTAPSRFELARHRRSAKQLQEELARATEPRDRTEETQRAETIVTLALWLSAHDARTRGHSERVRVFADMLADQLRLPAEERERLRWAALLHDVGKLTVPAKILNKPGTPDDEEWAVVRRHPQEGDRILRSMMPWFGDELGGAVAHHHEKWDGSGYPAGLAGADISLGGRLVAVADSFEVMTAARPYKRPMTAQAAREELVRCAGTHFDPDMVRAFLEISVGRLWYAIGFSALIAQVPALARLPERLGGLFRPSLSAGTSAVASLALVGVLAANGALNPYGLIQPVALTGPDSFTHLNPPFTAAQDVVTMPVCVIGTLVDRDHIYVDGCADALYRYSRQGGTATTAQRSAHNGLNYGLAVQNGRYYALADSAIGGSAAPGLYGFDPASLAAGPLLLKLSGGRGLVADPQSGDLFAVDGAGIERITGLESHPRLELLAKGGYDGLAITPDGNRLYAALVGSGVEGFDRNGHVVLDVVTGHGPDGIAVVRDGLRAGGLDLSGNLFVNANDGTILRIDTNSNNAVSVVASGGLRGDFITVGADGCLYATQANKLDRLEPCVFVPSNRV